jgi:hypothetical protein
VGSALFQFDPKSRLQSDGWIDESINWEDDESAISFTLNQKKPDPDNNLQFKVGVAIIDRHKLDDYINLPAVSGKILYERARIEGNYYHGNICILGSTPPLIRKRIAAGLANLVFDVKHLQSE